MGENKEFINKLLKPQAKQITLKKTITLTLRVTLVLTVTLVEFYHLVSHLESSNVLVIATVEPLLNDTSEIRTHTWLIRTLV